MKKIHEFLALGATAALLSACGGDTGSSATDTSESASAEVTTEPVVETPAADDVVTLDGTNLADFTGDAAAGERVFLQCRACHVVDAGVNRTGPSLAGIIGSSAGQVEGFNYTEENANSGIDWTPEKMFQYLENPRRVIPGTRMAFAGLRNGQDRADIIAYLQAN